MATIIVSGGDNLQTAINAATAGDTLQIRTGTFTGSFTVDKAIALTNYPGETPTITCGTNDPVLYVSAGATLHGLNIVGTYDLGEGSHFMEVNILLGGTSLITIENCTLTKFNHCGIKSMSGATPFLVQYCDIGTGGYANTDHCIYIGEGTTVAKTIRYNNLHHATGYGVHLYNYEHNCDTYGNTIHHNTTGGILVTGENHKTHNNTVAANGHGLDFFHYGLVNLDTRNNLVWGNTVDLNLQAGGGEGFSGCTFGRNDYHTISDPTMAGAGDIDSDPLFLGSTTWLDYRLQCASPCRGAGVAIAGISALDPRYLTLTARVAADDIGAFVY